MQAWRLGSYELIRQLGEGGMATVYLARDIRLGREVAVKVLDQRLAERSGFRERFEREARVAAALDHPNIVPLYDFGDVGSLLYLVMPYVSGGSLQDVLRRTPLPIGEVVTYGSQMADALDYAHQRNVVHRDVKPANMLLHADGRVMLSDFGLAKILISGSRSNIARGRPDAGTPEYMAPEQIEGRTDERADIYGLGVVLYLLLTGHLPFGGSSSNAVMEAHLYRVPEQPRLLNPAITPAMETVILRAMAKRPEERFQRAGDLGAALLGALVAGDAEPLPFSLGSAAPPASLPSLTSSHATGAPYMTGAPRLFTTETPRIPSQGWPSGALPEGLPRLDTAISRPIVRQVVSGVESGVYTPPGALQTLGRMSAIPQPASHITDAPSSLSLGQPAPPHSRASQFSGPLPVVSSSPSQQSDLTDDEQPVPMLRWWVFVAVMLMLALLAAGILLRWQQNHPAQALPSRSTAHLEGASQQTVFAPQGRVYSVEAPSRA